MKQIDTILQDVNVDTSTVKLVKCVQAHNEEGWIEYNLANCYDEFDTIRVLEGAVHGRPNSTPDGHSIDKTREIIKNFPDPANKIELYSYSRPFDSLEQMKQVFLDVSSPDELLCISDADEFYLDGQINRLRKILSLRPSLSQVVPMFLHFWRDAKHIRNMDENYTIQHQRFLRYEQGMRYHDHPVATNANGVCTYFSNEYQPRKVVPVEPLYIFHYGHAKGAEAFKAKKAFYDKELAKFAANDGKTAAQAFDVNFREFIERKEKDSDVLLYDGPHPSVMLNHPIMSQEDEHLKNKVFKHWKDGTIYGEKDVPLIAVWMYKQFARMPAIYNPLEGA